MQLRDVPFQFEKPGQLLKARRLHKSNEAARAELDELNEQSATGIVPDEATYLAREAAILAKYL
ncbi:hypothetical protein ABZ912_42490 [Nonomuraea angiospora]|uniref:hypothetical protein n=1 Tax=Nonomuraea angiospora TaxID=46172 RepID=UPI0033F136A5